MAGFQDKILVVITASAGGAITEIDKLGKSTATADTNAQKLSKTMKGALVAGAAAFIGTGLVSFLSDSVGAYADAAKAAGDLAAATGGSVENVSRMTAALEDAGIGADQARDMLTKFTTNAGGKNKDLLAQLNVELKTGKDGAIDYADGMVQAVDAIMKMGDASARNKALVDLFGKAGAKAFQDMLAAGVPLSEAMKKISETRVFNEEDVRKAADYDQAMDDLGASMEGVQNSIGRTLVPLISDVVGAFAGLLEILGEIPGETYLVVGAAVALNVALHSNLVMGALAAVETMVMRAIGAFALLRLDMGVTAAASTLMSTTVKGAMASMTAAIAANPVGAILVAITAGIALIQAASQNAQDEVAEWSARWAELEKTGMGSSDALNQTAEEWMKTASAWDKVSMESENWGWVWKFGAVGSIARMFGVGSDAVENFKDVSQDAREEMGEYAFQQGLAGQTQREFNDLVALGVTDMAQLGPALEIAAESQHDLNTKQELAKGLMEAYAAATWDAVDATLSMFDAQHQAESAQRNLTEAIEAYNKERTEENAAKVVDDLYALADASTAAWAAEEKRYGRVPNDMQLDAHRLQALKDGIAQLPAGSQVAQDMMDEFSRTVAAFATANPTTIPVGWTIEDINLAIANVQEQLNDPSTTPEQKVNLTADLTALTTLKTNIETGAAAEVPVTTQTDTSEAETALGEVTTDKTANVTVNTTFADGGYEAVKSRLDYITNVDGQTPDITVWTHFEPGGYEGVKSRLEYILSKDGSSPDINVWTHFHPGGYEAIRSRLDNITRDRTVNIDINTTGLSAAQAAINSIRPGPSAAAAAQAIILPPQPQPVNIVKVSVAGQELRATIRDELLNVRRSDDLAAAMGVVA